MKRILATTLLLSGCMALPTQTGPKDSPSIVVSAPHSDDRLERKIRISFEALPAQNGSFTAKDEFHAEAGTQRIRRPIIKRGWTDAKTYEFTLKFDQKARYGFDIVSDTGVILDATKVRLNNPASSDWIGVGDWSGAGVEKYFQVEVL